MKKVLVTRIFSFFLDVFKYLLPHSHYNKCLFKQDGSPGTCQACVTLGLPEQIFQVAHLLMMENNCANLY